MFDYSVFHKRLVERVDLVGDGRPLGVQLQEVLKQTKSVVYKKLRGEIAFTLADVFTLAAHYGFSTDQLTGNIRAQRSSKKGLDLELMPLVSSFETLTAYLKQAYNQLAVFNDLPSFTMTYVARDLPIFHYFMFRELGALKALVWVHESYKMKFRLKDVPDELLQSGANLYDLYTKINCTEIWSKRTIANVLYQISYYHRLKVLNRLEVEILFKQLETLLDSAKNDLIDGVKSGNANIDIVESPFIMMSNGAFMRYADTRLAMMASSTIQTIVVREPQLLDSLEASFAFQLRHGKALKHASVADIELFFGYLEEELKETQKAILG